MWGDKLYSSKFDKDFVAQLHGTREKFSRVSTEVKRKAIAT